MSDINEKLLLLLNSDSDFEQAINMLYNSPAEYDIEDVKQCVNRRYLELIKNGESDQADKFLMVIEELKNYQ